MHTCRAELPDAVPLGGRGYRSADQGSTGLIKSSSWIWNNMVLFVTKEGQGSFILLPWPALAVPSRKLLVKSRKRRGGDCRASQAPAITRQVNKLYNRAVADGWKNSTITDRGLQYSGDFTDLKFFNSPDSNKAMLSIPRVYILQYLLEMARGRGTTQHDVIHQRLGSLLRGPRLNPSVT